ncbi:hypothetical protein [Crassaminicella indica]|uniref:Uncharacterized protein n=1 Tax=Crassaminicella indica TaxID=2855394 RepID=A0ABX8RD39_9CLOT|nr:hypothetical protein [Crassaminicella indica]QXM06686.1 hypothetical protein KVH43_02905 [Crassaminicella indica]
MNKKNKILLLISLILLCTSIYVNVVKKTIKPIVIKKHSFKRVVEDIQGNTVYDFRYDIECQGKNQEKPSCQINIYAINVREKETLLNTIRYYSPKGTGNLVFKTLKDTKFVRVEIKPTSNLQGSIKMMKAELIDLEREESRVIMVNYKYLSKLIEKYDVFNDISKIDKSKYTLFANSILPDKNYKNLENSNKESTYFDGQYPINLSDKILFLGSTIEQINKNKVKIKFRFKCIDKLNIDYVLWFHGGVIDTKTLERYEIKNWDHNLPIETTEWEIGKIYEHEKTITSNPGQYYLKFGFWRPAKSSEDGNEYRLFPNIILGWIQIK